MTVNKNRVRTMEHATTLSTVTDVIVWQASMEPTVITVCIYIFLFRVTKTNIQCHNFLKMTDDILYVYVGDVNTQCFRNITYYSAVIGIQ